MSSIPAEALRWLQVEISSLCQAGCIDCNRWRPAEGYRYWDPGEPTEWLQNSTHPMMNSYYQVSRWTAHISKFSGVRHLQFCGNMGDPMAHPHIVDCCEAVKQHMPDCVVDISTNGGIGRTQHYEQLARMGVEITFAVDGLEDTNHIYRRGVSWQMVRERMSAFIGAGGKAQWQWIDFPHTRHQMERARKLSREWGFDVFDVRERFTQTKKFDRSIMLASRQPVRLNTRHSEPTQSLEELESSYAEQLEEYQSWQVIPGCAHAPDVPYHHPNPHINVDGTLWPCCFMANVAFHTSAHVRNWWSQITRDLPNDWNSLDHHTPQEILSSHLWQSVLPETWKNKTNLICLTHCGKCLE